MKEKVFTWLYRIFTYIVPCGLALWLFLIDKMMNKDITFMAKIGIGGVFTLILIAIIGIFFLGKYFRKSIAKTTDKIIVCMNNEEKLKLIAKKNKFEAFQEMFHNICFIAPFILCYFLIYLVEQKCVSIRGSLFYICISMAIGFGFNGISQYLHTRKDDD